MKRNTLARHRLTGSSSLFARTSPEGGGGGAGTGTGGSNDGGGSTAGNDPGAGAGTDSGRTPPTDPTDPNYFPPNTATADMTPDQRTAYWRFEAKRANDRVPPNLTELQQKAREYDELVAATRSDGEVAIDEALDIGREEGRAEVRMEAATEFLRSQLATGRTDDQVTTLMRGLNPAGFLTDAGAIDYAGIRAFAATLGGPAGGGQPDLGNGRRGGTGKPSVAGGRSLFQERNASKAGASSTTAN